MNKDWSFIICTHDPNQERVDSSIATILDLQIPNFEIIVIGGKRQNKNMSNTVFIDFDESILGWLTKKKNDAAKIAKYENLCVCHDYFAFDRNWYSGWINTTEDWNIASNKIKLLNGVRDWSDWISWDHPEIKKTHGVPYDDKTHTRYQFIAGHYYIVKKDLFLKNPLNESLIQAQQEDVEWSLRVRDNAKIIFNPNSIVRHLKTHRHLNIWRRRKIND